MAEFFDPVNLWPDFDPTVADPDFNTLKEYEQGGLEYVEFYFSPFSTAVPGIAPTRVYGVFARPRVLFGKNQTLVFVPGDADGGIDRDLIADLGGKGYAVLSVDLRGSGEGAARGATFYAAADACANYNVNADNLYAVGMVKKSCWYIWAAVCMRALSLAATFKNLEPRPLLLAKGVTASVGMILAANDKRFAGAALLFCNEPQTFAGDDGEKRFAGVFSAIANAPFVKCPILFMGATNDDRFSFEGFYEIFARIPAETGGVMSMSANLCREIGFNESRDIELFFEYLAKGGAPPSKPAISLYVSDNKPYFSVKPDPARPVERCALFYAYGGAACDRNWERKEAFMSADGEYIANIDCYDIPDPLYVYGAAYYEDGFSLCTRVLKRTPAELNVPVKHLVPSHLLYAPGGGRDSFTTVD
ncbi:MAG: alpha/beta hydrolase, partial [Clostridiales bacterium]|nr:alpha/beta hydrolase [Clostridiales bacterium]